MKVLGIGKRGIRELQRPTNEKDLVYPHLKNQFYCEGRSLYREY